MRSWRQRVDVIPVSQHDDQMVINVEMNVLLLALLARQDVLG
jgi:hypothetical protein